eukprot:8013475-Pyramimonas_sp.AAC.1
MDQERRESPSVGFLHSLSWHPASAASASCKYYTRADLAGAERPLRSVFSNDPRAEQSAGAAPLLRE